MRKRFIAGIMAWCLGLLLCFSAAAATSITDTSGHWAELHIEKWVNDGLIAGYPDGQFKPDHPITRAELVALVNRAFEIPDQTPASSFSDVKPSDWFYGDVMSGYAAGYIAGYPDGAFKPDIPITRQEAASLVSKLLGLEPGETSVLDPFTDQYLIEGWAKSGVSGVIAHGIMSGFPDKTFGPQKNITRAETVVTLDKALACAPEKISGIQGIVKRDNQPVEGATVRLFVKGSHEPLKDTLTSQDGSFSFTAPDGQYEITAVNDKDVGYAGPVTVTNGGAAGTQEVLLTTSALVTGKLVDKSGQALADTPFYFTTNPTFGGRTNNNGEFSLNLPMRGPDGQPLSYTGFFFHNGIQQNFVTGQQFTGDTNLDQVNTGISGQTTSNSGDGGNTTSDTTPPSWAATYPKTANVTQSGLDLLFNANENGTAYYVVLADNAAAPSAAEVKSGTGSGGSAVIQVGQQVLLANTEASVSISGLTAGTAYDIYVVAEDSAGNLQASPVKIEVTTTSAPGDTTAPGWLQGYPKTANVTQSGLDLLFNANENGTAYYVVLADNAAAPSAAEVKSGTGGGSAAIQVGQQALQANTKTSVTLTGLTAGTAYDIYVVAEDAAQKLQASPVKLEVTTLAAPDTTPPVWLQDYPKTANVAQSGFDLLFNANENGTAYYAVLADGAAAPGSADVKSGTGAIKHGQLPLQANTEASVSISGLAAGTSYDIYVVAEDAAQNLQTDPVKLVVTTLAVPDTTAPSWVGDYPKTDNVTHNGLKLLFKANEDGTAYYVVLAKDAAAPTAEEVKDGTGNSGAAAIKNGDAALQANTEASVNVSGLAAESSYDIYVVAEDAAQNLQTDPVKLVVTTLAAPALSLQYAAVDGANLSLTFSKRLNPASLPQVGDFGINVNGSGPAAPLSATIAGNRVTLALAQAVIAGDTVTVSYTPGTSPLKDEDGNSASAFAGFSVDNHTGILAAPANDPTVATPMLDSTAFLYSGDNAVQAGVDAGKIEEKRVAVLRGRVLTRDNEPLQGVNITVLDHPEFGSTLSRKDGCYDMVVNGGGVLTVRYEKEGYLVAQRQVDVPWQDFIHLPDVILVPYDIKVTPVTLGDNSPMQVVRGSTVSDKDGTRTATLILPADVSAYTVLPDGSQKFFDSLNVRATEYTVGENGPQAMPAELPPSVGYTYCVDYSADEAEHVTFSQPIMHYVENFIGAPVGGIVPMGYYDYDEAAWVPSENGRVIKILSITDGLADLDLDGSASAADADALAALSVTADERQKLAALYPAGQELWRVPITHFTPWDCNWPYGPPVDADRPNLPQPRGNNEENPCTGSGSIIEFQTQVLGESAKVYGTPFSLNYRSSRAEGNKNIRSLRIPISTAADLHPDLKRIELEISVAGQLFTKTFAPVKNQEYIFTWDGKDAYGRSIQGTVPCEVRIGYVYPAIYLNPAPLDASFSQYADRSPEGWTSDTERLETSIWQSWEGLLSYWDATKAGLGGWSLNIHHAYDPENQVLYSGDGSERSVTPTGGFIMSTVAGTGTVGYSGDGGPATEAELSEPGKIAIGPDGSIYIAETSGHRIRRVSPDGIITTVAGTSGDEYTPYIGDGGPATAAVLNDPLGMDIGPDGALYIADQRSHRIRRVGLDGIITTVAGSWQHSGGEGGPATEAGIYRPVDVAVSPDGSIYIADMSERVYRVGPDGLINVIVGKTWGKRGYSGDGGPATEALLDYPYSIDLGPDGSLYIADSGNYRVRRVDTSGIITTVAGTGGEGFSGDGGPAIAAQVAPICVEAGSDGSLYIADASMRIRRVGSDGIITTIAGNGTYGFRGDGGLAKQAEVAPIGMAVAPDGSLYISSSNIYNDGFTRIRRAGSLLPGFRAGEYIIPAEDGSKLFVFDSSGRHLRTINALTGSAIYTFTYDLQGRLTEVRDAFNNVTRIERDEQDKLKAIVAPGGQTTWLEVDAAGLLAKIICPLYKEISLEYSSEGLLTSLSDHKENVHRFTYDESGRLVRDEDPAGGYTELTRTEHPNGYLVRAETAEGRVSTYEVENLTTSVRRVNTDASGAETTILINNTDGTRQVTYPDGTTITMEMGPDPRQAMGMQAPVTSLFTSTTPAGLKSTVTRERLVEMLDSKDVLSVTKITDRVNDNGNLYSTVYEINKDNQTITVTSKTPEGRQIINKLDWYGRLIEEKTAGLEPISYSYDGKGRLTGVSRGNQQQTYTWDDMNRIIALEDAAGDKFHYEYNGADLLTKLTMPGGQSYAFGYDANGNVTAITMPSGATHQLDYTAVDLPLSYTPPANASYQKIYNRDRAVTQSTLPGERSVDYQYDSQGRITGMQYGSTTSSFGYADNTDRVSSIQRDPDDISYGFSYDGSLLTAMSVTGAVYGDYSYEYANDFKLIASVLGADTMSLTYDKDGLVTGYGDFTITRGHSFGLPTEISDGVMSITYNYDNFGRMTDRTHKVNNQQVYHLGLDYGNTGLISQKDESVAGAVYGGEAAYELHYEYDDNKQLTGVTGDRTETYTYDVNGNRLTGGAVYDAQDRLTKLGNVDYQFSDDGFLTRRGSDSFEYTAQGELVKVTLENGQEVTYTYDGIGRRVARSVVSSVYGAPVTEHYLYGNPGNPFEVTAVRDSDGSLSQYYYDQVNCLFAIKKDSAWYYVATDQQGTPRVVSDANGQIVKVIEYDSFGKLISDSNPDLRLPIGYAGGIADPETGLVHFGMRDYDPAAGRWTARDPILFNGRQGNLYVYVSNNPVNLRDPSGLFCIGGSYYAGVGIGGQLCITGEGVSLCGEVGFGVGGGVEISPFGGLAETGTKIYGQAEATYMGVGPSVGLSLDNCGSLKFEGALKAGPFSQSASYDFLEGKWALGDLSVGGEKANMNNSWLESFKPKISASAKVAGQGCVRF